MKSEWFVQSNPIGGEMYYAAARIRDTSKIVHSGNLEHEGKWTQNREKAEKLVVELNREGRM